MINTDMASREHAVSELLDQMSSCIEELNERLEQLAELREDMESEFETYSDETSELTGALEQYIEEQSSRQIQPADTETILEKLFLFDSITPMTQPERIAVYQQILSGQNVPADICSAAGSYLKNYREGCGGSSDLPFE